MIKYGSNVEDERLEYAIRQVRNRKDTIDNAVKKLQREGYDYTIESFMEKL